MRIPENVLAVLSNCRTSDNALFLPTKLTTSEYAAVNKVLVAAGGKWDRKTQAHLFDGMAGDAIDPIILTGDVQRMKQDFGQFDSPPDVVADIMRLAGDVRGKKLLEPSAGLGAIATEARDSGADVLCIELDIQRAAHLVSACFVAVIQADFLGVDGLKPFDIIAMNPPFAKRADIAHVQHALKFLKPSGRLVAVMSAGVIFRSDRLTTEFRQLVTARAGKIERLPEGSFRAGGTKVATCLVVINGEANQ